MRNNQETHHTEYKRDLALLEELANCGIFFIGHDEESNRNEFDLSNPHTVDDLLYFTRDELRRLGHAIIELADLECDHCKGE